MTLPLRIRKLALSAHVICSVGWLGAVGGFLALSIVGLTSQSEQAVRSSYVAMELTGWLVLVPLSLATLPSGLLMSLGTEWGLFRHYWVLAKLLITVLATILLLVHMQPVGHLASVVQSATLARGELAGMRVQLVADAGAALIALTLATVLSVYKPRGLTPFGRKVVGASWSPGRWPTIVGMIALLAVLLFVVLHLVGGGTGRLH